MPWQLGRSFRTAAVLAVALCATAHRAEAQPRRCKAGKVWHAGSCRYSDDVVRMKAAELARKQAQQDQQAADEAARQAELAKEKDAGACELARGGDTLEAWRVYLEQFPEGGCATEANERRATLEAERLAAREAEMLADKQRSEQRAAAAKAPREPTPVPRPSPMPPASPAESDAARSAAIAGFVAAGAGLITVAVAGPIALTRSSDLDDRCPDAQCVCAAGDAACVADNKQLEDDTLLAAHVTTAGFVLLGVGVAVGTIALLLVGDSREHKAMLRIGPTQLGFETSF